MSYVLSVSEIPIVIRWNKKRRRWEDQLTGCSVWYSIWEAREWAAKFNGKVVRCKAFGM